MIDRKDLIKAGVHWGHLKSKWCPRMAPYIWGQKDRIHLIDVFKTAEQMEKAAQFLKNVAIEGKPILWVGTKASAQEVIKAVAERLEMPYVNHRWVGGSLSNYSQVKKSVTRLLHFEDILARASEFPLYTKKDLSIIQKNIHRRSRTVGGIRKMTWPIGAIVIVDVNEEAAALREAAFMGVPIIAMVDTNGDPSMVDYVIPANDDTPNSVKIIVEYLADAVAQGKEQAKSKKPEQMSQARAPEVAAIQEDDSDKVAVQEILALEQDEQDGRSASRARSTGQAGPAAGASRTGARSGQQGRGLVKKTTRS